MMIKSALMTTGTDVLDGGTPAPNTNPALIFRQGAGHVRPNSAADPGLVYDSNINDWLALLCGQTTAVNPALCDDLEDAGYSTDASDTNVASIAIGDLLNVQTITRRVTNVGEGTGTYNYTLTGLAGFVVEVSPTVLTLGPGQTGSYTVKFTRTTANLGAYVGGQLTWSDGSHSVRSPVVVRPVPLVAPAEVSGTGAPIRYDIKFGYNGPFTATPRGLIPATTTDASVGDDPADSFDPAGEGVVSFDVVIPAGTTYARFSLFDADVPPGTDLDLYVFRLSPAPPGFVGISGGATSAEEVNLVNPAAGTYRVYVHGFEVDGTVNFRLFRWLLGTANAGNMSVEAPAVATIGGTGTIGLTFSGLTAGTKYLGSVAYGGAAGMPNPTIVRVDP
jgi:hypothetical protein